MNYTKPIDVKSPKDYVRDVNVLFDGKKDSFSLSRIKWHKDDYVYAIRWNVSMREYADAEKMKGHRTCIGMPSSHGVPVWFILPEEFNKHVQSFLEELKSK